MKCYVPCTFCTVACTFCTCSLFMNHPEFDRVKGHVRDSSSNLMLLLTSITHVQSFIILRRLDQELSWKGKDRRTDGHARRSHEVFWGTLNKLWGKKVERLFPFLFLSVPFTKCVWPSFSFSVTIEYPVWVSFHFDSSFPFPFVFYLFPIQSFSARPWSIYNQKLSVCRKLEENWITDLDIGHRLKGKRKSLFQEYSTQTLGSLKTETLNNP